MPTATQPPAWEWIFLRKLVHVIGKGRKIMSSLARKVELIKDSIGSSQREKILTQLLFNEEMEYLLTKKWKYV